MIKSVLRLYSVDNRMINESGILGGVRISKETEVLGENLTK
jgi:hypothetical protein